MQPLVDCKVLTYVGESIQSITYNFLTYVGEISQLIVKCRCYIVPYFCAHLYCDVKQTTGAACATRWQQTLGGRYSCFVWSATE